MQLDTNEIGIQQVRGRHFITIMVLTMQHCKLCFINLKVRFLCCVGLHCAVFVTFLFSFNHDFNLLYNLFDKIKYYIIVMFFYVLPFFFLYEKFILLISEFWYIDV